MKKLLFLKTNNGIYYFKADSFWTKSTNLQAAKLYSMGNDLDRILKNDSVSRFVYSDKLKEFYEQMHLAKLGYIDVDSKFHDNYIIHDNIKIEDLNTPVYEYTIYMKDIKDWKLISEVHNENINRSTSEFELDSLCEIVNYKVYNRDNIINTLIKDAL